VLQQLTAIIDQLPKIDNDPKYQILPANEWDRKASHRADTHKKK
jgi:hypothetical protein